MLLLHECFEFITGHPASGTCLSSSEADSPRLVIAEKVILKGPPKTIVVLDILERDALPYPQEVKSLFFFRSHERCLGT